MKTIDVEWYGGYAQSLNQAVYTGVEFAFLSADNKQVSPFAYCKDYLQDAVFGYLYQRKTGIYGFSYDPLCHPKISLNKTRILVTNSHDYDFKLKLPNCLDFLWQIEKSLHICRTKISACNNPQLKYIRPGVYLFEGSPRWLKSPPMLSLYTLMIRIGFGHVIGCDFQNTMKGIIDGTIKPYLHDDKGKLRDAKKGIDKILKRGDLNIFSRCIKKNYPCTISTNDLHNNSGIAAFGNEYTKRLAPHWHKKGI